MRFILDLKVQRRKDTITLYFSTLDWPLLISIRKNVDVHYDSTETGFVNDTYGSVQKVSNNQ